MLTIYDVTIPVMIRGLGILSSYLEKTAAHATQAGIEPIELIDARLAPDMMSLAAQVQRASDASKGGAALLAGIASPRFADVERTFDELQERTRKTIVFLQSIDPARLEGAESRSFDLNFPGVRGVFRGDAYALQVLLPNFFFHLVTAHDILRHQGLKIGKSDYFGPFP